MGIITDATVDFLKAIRKQAEINCGANTDAQALEVQVLYPNWEDFEEGAEIKKGRRVNYKGILYNVEDTHKKQANWPPDSATTLYTPTHGANEGTIENPIAWISGMKPEKDLYYTDEGIKYICIEGSTVGLYGQPKDLARYFKEVTE